MDPGEDFGAEAPQHVQPWIAAARDRFSLPRFAQMCALLAFCWASVALAVGGPPTAPYLPTGATAPSVAIADMTSLESSARLAVVGTRVPAAGSAEPPKMVVFGASQA